LAASSPREGGVYPSAIIATLDLLFIVIAIGWPNKYCLSLFLIFCKKVLIEWGQTHGGY
jgi:hypothetical protein